MTDLKITQIENEIRLKEGLAIKLSGDVSNNINKHFVDSICFHRGINFHSVILIILMKKKSNKLQGALPLLIDTRRQQSK